MTDKDYIRTRNKIERLVKKWKKLLWLGNWTIKTVYSKEDIPYGSNAANKDLECRAECNAVWHYMDACIRFNVLALYNVTDYELEGTVIHELVHCAIDEMSNKDCTHENLEHVTSMLTLILQELDLKNKKK